ncbi:cupin domain-containing protein [Sessilibacter sp. MAH4]
MMTAHTFNDEHITWQSFGDFTPAFYFSILNIDEKARIADVLFKLPAKQQIVLHRHVALNHIFVIQGDHFIYEPDGSVKEKRVTGSYTVSPANEVPHREGGGDIDTVVFFSIRPGAQEVLYELLDDDGALLDTVTFATLVAINAAKMEQ